MHPDEITPERFASVVDAITAALDTLGTQADRAELLASITRAFEVWAIENETSPPQQAENTPSEREVFQSLASATRSYWLDMMAADGGR